jgi:hypothetical protein
MCSIPPSAGPETTGEGSDLTEKRKEVHDIQLSLNMQPRKDSRLTEMFVSGNTQLSAGEVARELIATEFIYRNTLYGEIIEVFLRKCALRLREDFCISWKATWSIIRFYGPIALKLMCLDRSGLRIPDRLSPPSS